MLRKNPCHQFAPTGSDGCQDESLVRSLLSALGQTAFLKIIDHQGKIAAAGENAAREIAEVQRPEVIEGLQYGELAEREVCVFQPHSSVSHGGVGCAGKLYVGIQGAIPP